MTTLPPLPAHVGEESHGPSQSPVKLYDADQMHAYAASALASVQPAQPFIDAVLRLVKGFNHVSGIARQWEPDYSTGEDRAKWANATEACADVVRLMPLPQPPKD